MNTIRDVHFDFEMNISGEQASSMSRRVLHIVQEHLDAGSPRPQIIRDVHVDPIELPVDLETEDAAQRIAGAICSSIAKCTGRSGRG